MPPYAIQNLPYGLDTLDKDQKKTVFFRALLPIVLAENWRIWNERVFLLQQFGQGAVDSQIRCRTGSGRASPARYQVDGDLNDPKVRDTLLRRVDVVPVALVLAQAAQESGWGTSRFALEANNLFGIWTWDEDEGSVPVNRPDDATHLVRVYPDIQTSVRAYLHNINIGFAYTDFRDLRAEMRAAGKPLDPLQLAGALDRYSTAGDIYVNDIRAMLRSSELDKLGSSVTHHPSINNHSSIIVRLARAAAATCGCTSNSGHPPVPCSCNVRALPDALVSACKVNWVLAASSQWMRMGGPFR